MKIVSLASGSKGNSYFIKAGNTRVLIDCGISYKQLTERLLDIGETPNEINGVVLSHEHSDHVAGLESLFKKHGTKIYSNYLSAGAIIKSKPNLDGHIITFDNEVFKVGDILFTPISVSHDSVYCTAFRVDYEGNSVSVMTDLGFIDNSIIEKLAGCKVIYLESNHDERMLAECKYPYIIKKRIRSDSGHLSNTQAGNAIIKLYHQGTKFFVLSHISENSNTYEKAYITIANILLDSGINPDHDLTIRFAHQHRVGNNFILGDNKND